MAENPQQKGPVVGLLTSPWSILVSVGIAAFVGIMFKNVAAALRPLGQIYLYLIEMTVIPIIISAVVSSVASLAKSTGMRAFLLRMVVVLVLLLVAAAVVGTVGGVIGNPGAGLDEQTRNTLGSLVNAQQGQYAPDHELSPTAPSVSSRQPGLMDFLVRIVPRNVFRALSAGTALELIFFSIIFGVAIGVIGARYGESLIGTFDGFFKAFQKIIAWLMVALPFGVICLLADQIATTGVQVLPAMVRFIVIFYVVGLAVFVLDILVIWRRSHQRLGKVMRALLDPIVISLVTRNSFASLPTAIRSLTQELGFYERSTNLFLSLGVTLGRFGNIIYFAIASLFVAQLYGAELGIAQYGVVVVGSLFAGIATAGSTGIATLSLLSIVLGPLGLPLEAVLIIFIAIDTIADPLRSMLIILTNMAANTLIVPTVDTLNRRRHDGTARRGRSPAALDWQTRIRDRETIVVGLLGRDAPPLYYAAEDGRLGGISVELARRIADSLGVAARFDRQATSAAELVTRCREGEVDLIFGSCNFHQVFEEELAYSRAYVATRGAILMDKMRLGRLRKTERGLAAALRALGGSVGVVRGTIHERTAARLFPKAAIANYEDVGDLVDALFDGAVVAALGSELELKHMQQRRPARAASASCITLSNQPAELRVSIAPADRGALPLLDAAIAQAAVLPLSADVPEKTAPSASR